MDMAQQQHPTIGSWRIMLSPDGGETENHALVTFLADGGLISSPPPVEQFPLAEDGVVFVSSGHGAWNATGSDQIELGFLGQATNSRGELQGFGSVHATGQANAEGNRISGRYHFEIAGPDGIVFATEDGNVRGTRISAANPEQTRYLPEALATVAAS
jgi:hypothetical protein